MYQKHSATSREASYLNFETQKALVWRNIDMSANTGMTIAEIAHEMQKPNGTISARVAELEASNMIIKSFKRRNTYTGSDGYVYFTPRYFKEEYGRARKKNYADVEAMRDWMRQSMELNLEFATKLYDHDLIDSDVMAELNDFQDEMNELL